MQTSGLFTSAFIDVKVLTFIRCTYKYIGELLFSFDARCHRVSGRDGIYTGGGSLARI